jgi:hypothetical protein
MKVMTKKNRRLMKIYYKKCKSDQCVITLFIRTYILLMAIVSVMLIGAIKIIKIISI